MVLLSLLEVFCEAQAACLQGRFEDLFVEANLRVGIGITCALCGRTKKPIGRDAPYTQDYCEYRECEGYVIPPYPGQLWPGETEEEFGYLVGKDGTEEVEENGNR